MTEHLARDVRREQILDAATRMFVAEGYENSTVDEVAREAGLSKGSIYWYFKSKLDILFALTDRCVETSQAELVRLAAMDKYGPEALFRCHRDLLNGKLQDPNHEKLFSQLVGLAARHPEIQERLRDYYHKWDQTTQNLLKKAIDDGHFRDADTLRIAQAITALYDGLFMRVEVDPSIDMIAILETATKLMFDALSVHQMADSSEETR